MRPPARWNMVSAASVIAALLLMAAPSAARADDSATGVVVDTVSAKRMNASWTVDPRMAPQIGQSFTLDRPVLATRITLHPEEIARAKDLKSLVSSYKAENFVYLHGKGRVAARTFLNIWRSDDTSPLPTDPEPGKGFDVAAGGFTNVFSRTYDVPVDLSRPFDLPLDPGLQLEPGTYLAAWHFTFSDKRVFGIRFWGEVSGHSDGSWVGREWIPSVCRYAPLPDTSPAGSGAYVADQWASPYGAAPSGPFPGTIGYLTWFHPYVSKTPGCRHPAHVGWNKAGVPVDKKGRPVKDPYNKKYLPMNAGDLDMQIAGSYL